MRRPVKLDRKGNRWQLDNLMEPLRLIIENGEWKVQKGKRNMKPLRLRKENGEWKVQRKHARDSKTK